VKVTSLLSPESPESPIPVEKVRTVEIARRNEPVLVAKTILTARPVAATPSQGPTALAVTEGTTALAKPAAPTFKTETQPASTATEPPAFRPSQRSNAPPAFRPAVRPITQEAPSGTPASASSLAAPPASPESVSASASSLAAPAASPELVSASASALAAPGASPELVSASVTVAETAPESALVLIDRSGPLTPEDVPVGSPLAWRMVHINGGLLLDAGAIVPTLADRDFLFEQFEPQSESVVENAAAPTGKIEDASTPIISLADMGLMIGSRLGVRSAGAVQATYASRLIGLTPNDFIFITSPTAAAGRLSLDPRDTVEVVAVSSKAVFLFTCSVESVHTSPSPYAILSKPRAIRRLRERRAERIKTRFPVIFSTSTRPNAPPNGLGMVNDISDLGMALATGLDIGSVGDWIKVRFYLDMHASTVCVVANSQIRNVKTSTAEAGHAMNEYGLEFAELPAESSSVLRNFVLSHRSMTG